MATLHMARFQRIPPRLEQRDPGDRARLRAISALMWSLAGGLVLLFIFFAALGAFDPAEAVGVTIAIAAVGLVWLAHAWPRLRDEGRAPGSQRARERRGF